MSILKPTARDKRPSPINPALERDVLSQAVLVGNSRAKHSKALVYRPRRQDSRRRVKCPGRHAGTKDVPRDSLRSFAALGMDRSETRHADCSPKADYALPVRGGMILRTRARPLVKDKGAARKCRPSKGGSRARTAHFEDPSCPSLLSGVLYLRNRRIHAPNVP